MYPFIASPNMRAEHTAQVKNKLMKTGAVENNILTKKAFLTIQ